MMLRHQYLWYGSLILKQLLANAAVNHLKKMVIVMKRMIFLLSVSDLKGCVQPNFIQDSDEVDDHLEGKDEIEQCVQWAKQNTVDFIKLIVLTELQKSIKCNFRNPHQEP